MSESKECVATGHRGAARLFSRVTGDATGHGVRCDCRELRKPASLPGNKHTSAEFSATKSCVKTGARLQQEVANGAGRVSQLSSTSISVSGQPPSAIPSMQPN